MSTGTVARELLDSREDLPAAWLDAETRAAGPAAVEELTWSLVYHLLCDMVFREPLPASVRVGREQVEFLIDEATWEAFAQEIGLGHVDGRRQFTDDVARVLRREPLQWATGSGQVPRLAAGLAFLLDGFSRHAGRSGRTSPRQGSLGFDSGTPGQERARDAVAELIAWAGAAGTRPDDRYRIAFHVVWRPLSRRSLRQAPAPSESAAAPSLSLPVDFLERARRQGGPKAAVEGPALSPAPAGRAASTAPTPAEDRLQAKGDARAPGVLMVLIEPLLTLRGTPAAVIEQAEASASGLAVDVLRAWRRALLSEELELYGEPGAIVELELPDRAWRVAEGPFRPRATGGPRSMRVVRRGVLLGGDVLVPGVVVYVSSKG